MRFIYFCLLFPLLNGCNGVGTAEFKEVAIGVSGEQSGESGTDSSVVFGGVSSVSNKIDTSVTLNWTAHPDAVAYDVFNTTTGSNSLINSAFGQGHNSISLFQLTPGSTYKFRVRVKTAAGLYDTNTNDFSVTMNSAPDVPSSLALITPSVSPGYVATPTIRISGVKSGDTVKIFSDSSCSVERGSAVSSGSTIDITSSSLTPASYTFYATSTNASSNSSSCSTANVSYVLSSCPVGYIGVSGNASLSVDAFCVAQFEMKNVGGIAISQASGNPWVTINQTNAKNACTSRGSGYDLISNPEWMVIAHEIEKTASNWSTGVIGGVGSSLNIGHSDDNPSSACAGSVANVETNCSTTGVGHSQKRTHTLSNGEVIWDFAGNVSEWTDWALGGGLTLGPTTCTAAWTQLPAVSCGALFAADYMPVNPAGVTALNYNSTYGLGQFYGGAGGAARRGGAWTSGGQSGVFNIRLSSISSYTDTNIGFRCVFRP